MAASCGSTLLTMIEPRDPELLDARSVAQAEAQVKAAEAALRRVEPMLETAREAQALAEAEVTRMRGAHETKAISRSQLDEAEFEYRQASEEMRSARIAQEIAQFELQQARAALIRSRPRIVEEEVVSATDGNGESEEATGEPNGSNGWNLPIYSPIDGRVLRVLQESSAVVTPGTPLVELGDPADLEVEIDVLSRDAVRINPGDLVLLEHWGGTRPLRGEVRIVEPSGFTKISTLGVEEQRVYVIVDLIDPLEERGNLGDGFRVEARVVIDEAQDVLKIPTSALFRVGTRHVVFLVIDDVVHLLNFKVGRQNGLEAEILEGLAEADRVILHPSDRVEEDVKVRQR
jgi:HlyD family secretion protein